MSSNFTLENEKRLSFKIISMSFAQQGNIVHPFSLSYHPFAMLSSFKAVERSRKHSM